jgi:ribonuclease HI
MLPKINNAVIKPTLSKVYPEFNFIMNFDGCSKGNPGVAGAGAVIYNDEQEIWSGSFFVGENATNNHAEYAGLILGLQQAIEFDIKHILVKGDSQLVINHMNGTYKCKSPNLIELYDRAKELEAKFDKIYFHHVLRKFNKRADELSNEAIKDYKI